MTTADLIDRVLAYTDNVESTDADYTERRAKIRQFAQEIVDEVWVYRDWRFAQRSATVTVDGTTFRGPLPADFVDIGDLGGVYNAANGWKLEEVHPQELLLERERSSYSGGTNPDCFAIMDQSTSGSDKGQKYIQLQRVSANISLKVWYQCGSPTLVDATDATNNLELVPVQYHQTVILAGVVAMTRKVKGEILDWNAKYREGLAWMWTREKPRKGAVQRMPRAIVGMW